METIKKFYYMDVYDRRGKSIGYIQDVGVNFHTGRIDFFQMMPRKIFSKPRVVINSDVISFSHNMVINKSEKGIREGFRGVKNIPIENFVGKLLGVLEDVVIDHNLNIVGIHISPGVIKKYYDGMEFAFLRDLVVENKKIYYMRSDDRPEFKVMFSRGETDVEENN